MHPIEFIRTKILKISQSELAAIAQTTQPSVSRWEKGESEPDRDEMGRIRKEVRERGHDWDDKWFFEVPAEAVA